MFLFSFSLEVYFVWYLIWIGCTYACNLDSRAGLFGERDGRVEIDSGLKDEELGGLLML